MCGYVIESKSPRCKYGGYILKLIILDILDAKRQLETFPYVISILDNDFSFPIKSNPETHHIERFRDNREFYLPEGPTLSNITSIVDKIKKWNLNKESEIMIHCTAGLSRSPAIAYAVLIGVGYNILEARDIIFKARPQAVPSIIILHYIDICFGLCGKLLKIGITDHDNYMKKLGG